VAFLVSKKADYITGINLDVAGGYHLHLHSLETDRRPVHKNQKAR
jgi:hypothetical protein